MKVAQLVEGKTYQDKKGVRRNLRQLTGPTGFTPNAAYYVQEGENLIKNISKQEFAAWAKTEAEHFREGIRSPNRNFK